MSIPAVVSHVLVHIATVSYMLFHHMCYFVQFNIRVIGISMFSHKILARLRNQANNMFMVPCQYIGAEMAMPYKV